MSDQEKFGNSGIESSWKKPSVKLAATAGDVRGGVIPSTFESDPVYMTS
jgi:hypothetical protein